MNDKLGSGVHWSFWLIATIAFIWNAMGVVNYFVQMNPDVVDAYRASEQRIISGPAIEFGAGEIVGIIILPLVLAAFLVWYTRYVDGKDWLS